MAAMIRTSTLTISARAERHELAFLDDSQELGLRLGTDVADFVKEDRAPVGDLEISFL